MPEADRQRTDIRADGGGRVPGLMETREGNPRSYERSDMETVDIWVFRADPQLGYDPDAGRDLSGYRVEATDGSIGKIDEATDDVRQSFIIVDTGPWILGKKVMLPAGVIQRVDEQEEKVWVDRTKDQIKNAPEYDETLTSDSGYRDELGTYYGPGGRGYTGSNESI
jgi:hypothetical protein